MKCSGISAIAWLAWLFVPTTHARETREPVVAYVERVIPAGAKLGDVAKVTRAGVLVPISDSSVDLIPGDKVRLKLDKTALVIRMIGSNQPVLVTKTDARGGVEAHFTVPRPALPGLMGDALAWFKAVLISANNAGAAPAFSRGAEADDSCFNRTGLTDQPRRFEIPSLSNVERPTIAAGHRSLLVTWRGGVAPFTIELAEASASAPLAAASDIQGWCAVRLPKVTLRSGTYRLVVRDFNGARLVEQNLTVADDGPVLPAQLAVTQLSDEARKLYFATWLTLVEQGKWSFEALQLVGMLGCSSPASSEWLAQRGGVPPGCVSSPASDTAQ